MKKLILICLALFCFIGLVAQSKRGNPYHTSGTKEYQTVTAKLFGEWNITSFTKGKTERIGTDFVKASVDFKEFNENGNGGVVIFRFVIPQTVVDERVASYNKKGNAVTVDSYIIETTIDYKINKTGDIIYLENQMNKPIITGSGDKFDNFQINETEFITAQSELKNEGGATNLLTAKILKTISSTEFIPRIPSQVNYKNITDNSVDLITLSKTNFKLTR
ncbi:MAG: hypothetical protein ACD_77C00447G0002 [uncultured bacterium]|nr:MAG: hypothetical protein ACD_77C00447G0002 [uncultured bacterium]HBY01693.1 hypothetical protein [Rikenellaceae bacterium]